MHLKPVINVSVQLIIAYLQYIVCVSYHKLTKHVDFDSSGPSWFEMSCTLFFQPPVRRKCKCTNIYRVTTTPHVLYGGIKCDDTR